MYDVMKAIYDSGIPVNFKGSMVMKACLIEAGYTEETRHTVDIDANWNTEVYPSAEQMVESIQNALLRDGVDLNVSLYRMYGEGRSAGFDFKDSLGNVLFTMDVDVNRPIAQTKIYEVDGIRFCGVVSSQMITDKIVAISSDKVFSRIKDVIDLYYLSAVVDFDRSIFYSTLMNSERKLDKFYGFLHRKEDLRHSYEKFRFAGGVGKPPFEDVYSTVKSYISGVLPREKDRDIER